MKSVGSNSGMSAAICTFSPASARSGTRRTPERPSRSDSQKASTPIPIGVTGPIPGDHDPPAVSLVGALVGVVHSR